MNDMAAPRVGVDCYLEWLQREGIPVTEDFGVDLLKVPTAPWARVDANGAAVHLKGRGDFLCMFVFDIEPGKATAPQKQEPWYRPLMIISISLGCAWLHHACVDAGVVGAVETADHSHPAAPLSTGL